MLLKSLIPKTNSFFTFWVNSKLKFYSIDGNNVYMIFFKVLFNSESYPTMFCKIPIVLCQIEPCGLHLVAKMHLTPFNN